MPAPTRPSSLRPFLLGTAFGAAVVALLVWGLDARDPEREAPPAAAAGASASPSPAPGLEAAGPPRPAPEGNEAGADAEGVSARGADANAAAEAAPPSAVAARLRVVLRIPEAWRAASPVVYALPAGAPGRDDEEDVPHVEVGERAAVELLLPSEGPWDVGVRTRLGHVLRTDVRARDDADVVLTAPPVAPIRFRYVGDPAALRGAMAHLQVQSVADAACAVPGRGQGCPISVGVQLDARGEGRTAPLPGNRAFRVRTSRTPGRPAGTPSGWLEVRPPEGPVHAGDEVLLSPVPLVDVRLRLRLRGPVPDAWLAGGVRIWAAVRAEPEGGAEESHRYASTWVDEGGRLLTPDLVLPLPPGRYALRSGIGRTWEEAVRTLVVAAGEPQVVDVDLRPDPRYDPRHPEEAAAVRVETTLRLEGGRPGHLQLFAEVPEPDGTAFESFSWKLPSEDPLEVMSREASGPARAFLPPDRVSAPFRLAAHGETRVVLRPAGMLQLVPEQIVPDAVGTCRLRRVDGGWIPRVTGDLAEVDWAGGDVELELVRSVRVEPQTVIGPLPTGRHEFEVVVGGIVVGRLAARVRPGTLRPLAVPVHPEGFRGR